MIVISRERKAVLVVIILVAIIVAAQLAAQLAQLLVAVQLAVRAVRVGGINSRSSRFTPYISTRTRTRYGAPNARALLIIGYYYIFHMHISMLTNGQFVF